MEFKSTLYSPAGSSSLGDILEANFPLEPLHTYPLLQKNTAPKPPFFFPRACPRRHPFRSLFTSPPGTLTTLPLHHHAPPHESRNTVPTVDAQSMPQERANQLRMREGAPKVPPKLSTVLSLHYLKLLSSSEGPPVPTPQARRYVNQSVYDGSQEREENSGLMANKEASIFCPVLENTVQLQNLHTLGR